MYFVMSPRYLYKCCSFLDASCPVSSGIVRSYLPSKMARIETYVFLDMGTTGPTVHLSEVDVWMPEITELCMLAVKREALLLCEKNKEPRVMNKFNMCLKPSTDKIHERLV